MPTDFKFPDIGEGITEGEIVEWEVREGDQVSEHQTLVKIETDKAIVEVPSPRPGIVLRIYHKEGDTIKVGETLVTIGEPGEKVEEVKKKPTPPPAASVVGVLEEAPLPSAKAARIIATPATRKLARELGVDLAQVTGTGPEGRTMEDDVRKFAEAKQAKQVSTAAVEQRDAYGTYQIVPMRGVRKSAAKRVLESARTAVHVTHMDDADVTELVKLRESLKKLSAKKRIRLTYMPFMITAAVDALKQYPHLNSSVDDGHEQMILKKYYNIGVAVDTADGLIVPVVKNADQKDIFTIAEEIQRLSERAQARTLDLADLRGGTFTITNIGFIGGTHATPIINYPETAILATGRITERPVVRDGSIVIRSILPLSLTFDHRVIDGAMAARFLSALMQRLEDPGSLL